MISEAFAYFIATSFVPYHHYLSKFQSGTPKLHRKQKPPRDISRGGQFDFLNPNST
jgi:hypothetical protein